MSYNEVTIVTDSQVLLIGYLLSIWIFFYAARKIGYGRKQSLAFAVFWPGFSVVGGFISLLELMKQK